MTFDERTSSTQQDLLYKQQVYDIEQAFDALWLEDTMNDLYDALLDHARDDKLALVYKTNTSNLVAAGPTERVKIPTIVQQGSVWGPMQCSVSVDKIPVQGHGQDTPPGLCGRPPWVCHLWDQIYCSQYFH